MKSTLNALRGLTLIEMMVSLSIASIVLMLATPSFVALIERNRVTTAANDFLRALVTARTHALAIGDRFVVAPPVVDGDWHDGWQIFLDANNNAALDGAPDSRIQTFAALPASISMTPNVSYGNAGNRYVSFDTIGSPRTAAGVFAGNGAFVFQSGNTQRTVCFNLTGRAWVVQGNVCN